ncbi:hypothetical protein [Hymenobacter volaticus]|uniref:Uncharacterized protein n=1 Tax=Hymenobacter volaticus TaxID=2932254 RepID=A0ABY4GFP3_9BACT|nr:hypothetical protein [Hymenobacter volaticus]UOQ69601.1 hypothetical protein MUN86_29280 [Hymenobacter volaticus]
MNLNELDALWKAHKQQVEEHDLWSEQQLAALLTPSPPPARWALRPRRAVLHLCLVLLSFALGGC